MCEMGYKKGSTVIRNSENFVVNELKHKPFPGLKNLVPEGEINQKKLPITVGEDDLRLLQESIPEGCAIHVAIADQSKNLHAGAIMSFDRICWRCNSRVSGELIKLSL
jgi:hypothetical protein